MGKTKVIQVSEVNSIQTNLDAYTGAASASIGLIDATLSDIAAQIGSMVKEKDKVEKLIGELQAKRDLLEEGIAKNTMFVDNIKKVYSDMGLPSGDSDAN